VVLAAAANCSVSLTGILYSVKSVFVVLDFEQPVRC